MPVSDDSKLYFFYDLINELRTVLSRINLCDYVIGLEKTTPLATCLIDTIFVPVSYLHRLHQDAGVKVPLSWLAEMSQDNILHDTPSTTLFRDWLKIPENYHIFKVWCHVKDLYFTPLELLAWWVTMCKSQPISMEWIDDPEYITFATVLSGEFKAQRVEFENVNHDFWMLEVESDPPYIPSESLSAALLIVQLAAQQGGGVFMLRELSEQQLEIHFRIPRAETSVMLPQGWRGESNEERKCVTDHIIRLITLGFKKACQQLKLALSTEDLPRLVSQIEKKETNKEYDLCIRGLHQTIVELDRILEALDNHLKGHAG